MEREVIMLAEDERIVIIPANKHKRWWSAFRMRFSFRHTDPSTMQRGAWIHEAYGDGNSRIEALDKLENDPDIIPTSVHG